MIHRKSLLKTITWRVIATIITASIALSLTGSIGMACEIGGLDATIKMIAYYWHEKLWL